MTYQNKLRRVGEIFSTVHHNCYHYFRTQKAFPCIVWQEDGASGMYADDLLNEPAPSGVLEYYTQMEYDPIVDGIMALKEQEGLCLTLQSVQFEEAANLIHYTWSWEA